MPVLQPYPPVRESPTLTDVASGDYLWYYWVGPSLALTVDYAVEVSDIVFIVLQKTGGSRWANSRGPTVTAGC
jgi:hypothetical protein